MTGLFEVIPASQHFPWIRTLMQLMPQRIAQKIAPGMNMVFHVQRVIRERVSSIVQDKAVPEQDTIFHTLLQSDIPEEEKGIKRLSEEAFVLIVAGTESTAQVLTILTYHLLQNPEILSQLRKELDEAMPDLNVIADWQTLETLTFLSAVVKEGLRIAAIVTLRLAEIAPDESLVFRSWTIPPRTPVAMSAHSILRDPSIFPDPGKFDPSRWIGAANHGERLEHFLVPFSKGSRACLGLNLAYAELYLTIAAVVRRFEFELLADTDQERDVDIVRDCFVGLPSKESRGVRVHVRRERDF